MPFVTTEAYEDAEAYLIAEGYVKDEETTILWRLPEDLKGWDFACIMVGHGDRKKYVIRLFGLWRKMRLIIQ